MDSRALSDTAWARRPKCRRAWISTSTTSAGTTPTTDRAPAMTQSVCDSCGAQVLPDTQFCTSCGYFLGWNESQPGDGPDPQPRRPGPVSDGRTSPVPSDATFQVREPSV